MINMNFTLQEDFSEVYINRRERLFNNCDLSQKFCGFLLLLIIIDFIGKVTRI